MHVDFQLSRLREDHGPPRGVGVRLERGDASAVSFERKKLDASTDSFIVEAEGKCSPHRKQL